MTGTYDAVVVGAGPAGLSAAAELKTAGSRVLLVEQGRSHEARDRAAPEQILAGVGGAGLFSDGKHSFFPAATELWVLPHRTRLEHAYASTSALLARHGVSAPPLSAMPPAGEHAADATSGTWRQKVYPSVYASLEERLRCIAELRETGGAARLDAQVVGARRNEDGMIALVLSDQAGRCETVLTRHVVVATGRLSPRALRSWLEPLGVAFAFRRLEVGVRIESRASAVLFAELDGVDPKLSFLEPDGTRFHTFCMCRNGEVVVGSAAGVHAVSGRADGAPTGRSSVGLLVRVTEPDRARTIASHVLGAAPMHCLLADAAGPILRTFGKEGGALIEQMLARFAERFPSVGGDRDATVHAPCIEGVGDYPVSDAALELAPGVLIAGDACGRFRGIVASMVSGRYVAAAINEAIGGGGERPPPRAPSSPRRS